MTATQPRVMWEVLCGNSSAFWDYHLSWNTTNPDLTECFQNTVLVWVPCLVLWIFLPLEICYLKCSKSGHIRWNLLNTTKQISCTFLLILFIAKLGVAIFYRIPIAEYYSPALMIISLSLANVLVYLERKRGIQISALLFFFWLFLTLSEALAFRSKLLHPRGRMLPEARISYSLFMVHYPLLVSQLILSIFKDAEPLYSNPDDIEENACPKNASSFFSKLTFSWFDRLLWLGYRHALELTDVWNGSSEVLTKNSVPKVLSHLKTGNKGSLQRVIWKSHWPTFVKGWSVRLLGDTLIYANPFLLKQFLAFVSNDEPFWHGYLYVFGMFVASFSNSMCARHGSFYGLTARIGVSSSFISMIYRKCLTLCSSSKMSTTTGEIINHMSVDVDHVADFMYFFVFHMTYPFQISLGFYMLYNLLGLAAFAGLGAMVVMIVVSGIIANQIQKVEVIYLKYKDKRIKQINEAILGIKVLKLFAWEKPFLDRITAIRKKEAFSKTKGLILQGSMTVMWRVSTLTVSLVCFTTYLTIDPKNVLDASTAFITIILVDIISIPMMQLPILLARFVQAYVSICRLNRFMASKDLDPSVISHDEHNEYAIAVDNASFTWDLNQMPLLCDVTLKVSIGSLVAVVGPVGCGKSSLIAALLGEMDKLNGTVNTKGSIAYVPQQAWIQNATFKENILFGKPFQERSYNSIIRACALEPDLDILPGGDETEIGEKGINLSGGQKQRVSLARAVFNDADIYLLDDPLSAVDSHVGEHIFEHVVGPNGLLKHKTRFLVTHGIAHLPKVDEIVVICKGRITEVGKYYELVERKGAFSEFLSAYGQAVSADPKSNSRTGTSRTASLDDKGHGKDDVEHAHGIKLTTTEHVEKGQVSVSVYFLYAKYVGVFASVGIVALLAISVALSASANIWLSIWSSDPVSPNPGTKNALQNMRLAVYAALELSFTFAMLAGILTLILTAMKAAISLHSKMLWSIFRSPMSFFDTTPSGRIVNRFSKDVDTVDNVLPNSFQEFLVCLLEIISAVIVICIKLPWLILVYMPVAFLYYMLQKFFVKVANQLRRLDSTTRSPIYSRFSETIAGASTVRAFQLQNQFIQQLDNMIDTSLKNKYHFDVMCRWIGVRLDFLGNVTVICTALFAMFQRSSMDASTIALIVTYANEITLTLGWIVYNAGMLESNIVSVERLHEYISLKSEAPWEEPNQKPSSTWPAHGNLQFLNYSTKYRNGLPDVLHGLSCQIHDREKIGVVGRTGAGKSSMALSLFRLIEATGGTIIIDGVDISKIGLHDLRNHLTIIPQEPVLYSGSLRMNLDPFDQHSDGELWNALELAHMKTYVSSLESELQHEIAEGGENLSVGQRQLICLARALLRKTKILILDEATAAVDLETDDLIQATIRQEFANCTIITIAHRINTIMDSSRVIVMDNGSIREFDQPSTLLNDKKSMFYSMSTSAGLVE